MLMQHNVENIILVMDLADCSTSDVPYNVLQMVIGRLNRLYPYVLHKSLVVNMNWFMKFIFKMASSK